jgi:hypothetical protein
MDAEYVPKYECVKCDFRCTKNSDWSRHILTKKHQKEQNETPNKKSKTKSPDKKSEKHAYHKCSCGVELKSRSTIWRHKKKCQEPNGETEIIKMLIKENSEFKNVILEMMKTIQMLTNDNKNLSELPK